MYCECVYLFNTFLCALAASNLNPSGPLPFSLFNIAVPQKIWVLLRDHAVLYTWCNVC